ncbi:hypothetical protein F2P81_022405 [Scophthalmus maximus]|uniref:Uncharacterized protein n=1 Tax=Scophthalmus maximus TaxID=52904 RepID=A0A6A4S4U0_SCOMX|nr:hypothetical protein F2P81_022405 [Scophthalmus maximus]
MDPLAPLHCTSSANALLALLCYGPFMFKDPSPPGHPPVSPGSMLSLWGGTLSPDSQRVCAAAYQLPSDSFTCNSVEDLKNSYDSYSRFLRSFVNLQSGDFVLLLPRQRNSNLYNTRIHIFKNDNKGSTIPLQCKFVATTNNAMVPRVSKMRPPPRLPRSQPLRPSPIVGPTPHGGVEFNKASLSHMLKRSPARLNGHILLTPFPSSTINMTCVGSLTAAERSRAAESKSSGAVLSGIWSKSVGKVGPQTLLRKRYDPAAAAFSGKNRCCCLEVSSVRTLPHHSSTFRTLKNVFSESVDALTGYRLT